MALRFTHWRRLETTGGNAASAAYRKTTIDSAEAEAPPTPAGVSRLSPGPTVKTPGELTELENHWIVSALTAGQHDDVSLGDALADPDRFFEGIEDIQLHVMGAPVEWWDVIDDEDELQGVFVLWGNDCGQLYAPSSVERRSVYVAQFALWCQEDWGLWKELSIAHRTVRAHFPESDLAKMAFWSHFRCRAKPDGAQCHGSVSLWKETDDDAQPCPKCGGEIRARNGR